MLSSEFAGIIGESFEFFFAEANQGEYEVFDEVVEMRFEKCESCFGVDTVKIREIAQFRFYVGLERVELTTLRRSTEFDTFLSVATILRAQPSSRRHRDTP